MDGMNSRTQAALLVLVVAAATLVLASMQAMLGSDATGFAFQPPEHEVPRHLANAPVADAPLQYHVRVSTLENTVLVDRAPAPPDGLIVSGVSKTRIALTWNPAQDDHGITGYSVYREGVLIGSASSPSFRDEGLRPGATYVYEVRARDTAGQLSAPSAAVFGSTSPDDGNRLDPWVHDVPQASPWTVLWG